MTEKIIDRLSKRLVYLTVFSLFYFLPTILVRYTTFCSVYYLFLFFAIPYRYVYVMYYICAVHITPLQLPAVLLYISLLILPTVPYCNAVYTTFLQCILHFYLSCLFFKTTEMLLFVICFSFFTLCCSCFCPLKTFCSIWVSSPNVTHWKLYIWNDAQTMQSCLENHTTPGYPWTHRQWTEQRQSTSAHWGVSYLPLCSMSCQTRVSLGHSPWPPQASFHTAFELNLCSRHK